MANIERLLRANRTVVVVPTTTLADGTRVLVGADGSTCPFEAPTAAVVDSWVQITSTTPAAASHGGNISCALLDDLTLGTADSETDDELTICSIGNESTPTFYNLEAALTFFRDKNKADPGVFNLARLLFSALGSSFALVDRIGYSSTTAAAAGQDMSFYGVETDAPVDTKEDRGNLKIAQSPTFMGDLNTNHTIAA